MLIGYLAARLCWLDTNAIRGLSLFVFNFVIPPLLFRNTVTTELPDDIPWGMLLSFYLSVFTAFALGMFAVGIGFGCRLGEQAVAGFSAAFGNTVLLGIPLALTAFGAEASLPVFLIIAFHSLLLLPTATVIIEISRGHSKALAEIPWMTLRGLLSNPLIIALLLGLLFNLAKLPIPGPVDAMVKTLAQAALPCALFAMGASLSQYRIAGNIAQALVLVGLKILLLPLLVWVLAVRVFHLPDLWIQALVLLAAMPTGVNGYLLAQRYQFGVATTATAIVISTALSVVSLPLILHGLVND